MNTKALTLWPFYIFYSGPWVGTLGIPTSHYHWIVLLLSHILLSHDVFIVYLESSGITLTVMDLQTFNALEEQ